MTEKEREMKFLTETNVMHKYNSKDYEKDYKYRFVAYKYSDDIDKIGELEPYEGFFTASELYAYCYKINRPTPIFVGKDEYDTKIYDLATGEEMYYNMETMWYYRRKKKMAEMKAQGIPIKMCNKKYGYGGFKTTKERDYYLDTPTRSIRMIGIGLLLLLANGGWVAWFYIIPKIIYDYYRMDIILEWDFNTFNGVR